jgi:cytochrome b pre-mRNA-processing protein 3
MGLGRLLKPRGTATTGRRLYDAAVAQARQPALYVGMGAPDTVEGRFELYTLHVVLVLHRLKNEGQRAADLGQALFDAYLQGLDDALREIGVGDLSVGKKMRKLGEAFYGRARNYDDALAALPDAAPLEDVISRTVLEGVETDPAPLTAYAVRCAESLKGQAMADLLEGRVQWPQAAP